MKKHRLLFCLSSTVALGARNPVELLTEEAQFAAFAGAPVAINGDLLAVGTQGSPCSSGRMTFGGCGKRRPARQPILRVRCVEW